MLYELAIGLATVTGPVRADPSQSSQGADSTVFVQLEGVWNRAHLTGDTTALAALWIDDLVVVVPEMPLMSKAELLGFWRSGRSNITRYETSALRIRIYADVALVVGLLSRERNFNGRIISDRWQFTKVYVRRPGRWQVASYHASPAPPP